jgi:glucan biosynthesis protein C
MISIGVAWSVALAVVDYFGPNWLHQQVAGLINPVEWLSYAPYFFGGIWLYRHPGLLTRFSRTGWFEMAAMVMCSVFIIRLGETDGVITAAAVAVRALLTWLVVRACFALFRHLASGPSPGIRYLSDASYTVYLVHHILVIGVASLLLPMHLPALAKFGVVLFVASALALGIHHMVIRPSRFLTLLFNGRRLAPSSPR